MSVELISILALVGAIILFVRKILLSLVEKDDEVALRGLHHYANLRSSSKKDKKELDV